MKTPILLREKTYATLVTWRGPALSFCIHFKYWNERDEFKDFADPTNRICLKCMEIKYLDYEERFKAGLHE